MQFCESEGKETNTFCSIDEAVNKFFKNTTTPQELQGQGNSGDGEIMMSPKEPEYRGAGKQPSIEKIDDLITRQREFDRLFLINESLAPHEIQESLAILTRIYSSLPGMDVDFYNFSTRNIESRGSTPSKLPWITSRASSASH